MNACIREHFFVQIYLADTPHWENTKCFEVGSEQFINFKNKAGWADVEDDSSVCENEEC